MAEITFSSLESFVNADNEEILQINYEVITMEGETEKANELIKSRDLDNKLNSLYTQKNKIQEQIDFYEQVRTERDKV